jgi:lysophospholipase L1-like esterase
MSRRHLLLGSLATSLLSLAVAAPAAAAASTVDYVALGDSYSSGVGAPGQTGSCLRSPNGYPAQWAAENQPQSFTNLTCGGAVTGDVIDDQVPAMPGGTDLVSITIGGNDIGFAPTVLTCKLSTEAACAAAVDTAEEVAATTLPGLLDDTYAAIEKKAPGAEVVVLGYPRLFEESASCGIGGMSLANRKKLNEGADLLAEAIKGRVLAAGLTFSDVRDEFAGHGICAAQPYLNGLVVIPASDSYHPNQDGYTYAYLPAFAGAV